METLTKQIILVASGNCISVDLVRSLVTTVFVYRFVKMSSSKRKLASEKSSNDEKSKLSVFDRLGPGLSSRTAEPEVKQFKLISLLAVLKY